MGEVSSLRAKGLKLFKAGFSPSTAIHATVRNFLCFRFSFHDLLTPRKSNTELSYTFPCSFVLSSQFFEQTHAQLLSSKSLLRNPSQKNSCHEVKSNVEEGKLETTNSSPLQSERQKRNLKCLTSRMFSFRFALGAMKLSTIKTRFPFALANILIPVGFAHFACEITKLWSERFIRIH